MATKRLTWQKRPGDQYFLELISSDTGLDHSAILRLALREYAYTHGYALPESVDVALSLRETVTALQLCTFQDVDGLITRGKRVLKRHRERIRKAYDCKPYPAFVERELAEEEQRLNKRVGRSKRER